jgi:hypothetical protein
MVDLQGQELDSLSLADLMDLEANHTKAHQLIFSARAQRQEEENNARNNQLNQLKLENQRLLVLFPLLHTFFFFSHTILYSIEWQD